MKNTITIDVLYGKPETVRAVVRGDWALHRPINRTGDGYYTLTYIPSGQCIDWLRGSPVVLARTLRNVAAVGAPPVDPRRLRIFRKGTHPAGYMAWVSAVMAAMGSAFQPPIVVDFVGEIRL